MALSQDDRIAFSRKIVTADGDKAVIDRSQQEILSSKAEAQKLDTANKNLMDLKTPFINGYQSELSFLDGNVRTVLLESDLQNSSVRTLNNFFYPNNLAALPPSLSTVWIQTKPYARTVAVGRNGSEAFTTTTKESDLASLVDSAILSIETTFLAIERATGQTCTNGTCSLPIYINSSSCTTNGGVWTPGLDTVVTYPAVGTALTDLTTKVNNLKSLLISQSAAIITNDTNSSRNANNLAAKNQIDNIIIPAINTWLAYNNFDTSHGQTTCTGFFGYNVNLLGPSKLRPTELNALKSALTTRAAFTTTRSSQLTTNLGSVVQNISNGSVTGSGLYYERFLIIQLRLNLLGGSLIALTGYDKADQAQTELKENIDTAKAAYQAVLFCSAMSAPANGTKFLHTKDASGFLIGDTVYVVTETQQELRFNVEAVSGNRLTLGQPIPSKYKESDLGRVYKEI